MNNAVEALAQMLKSRDNPKPFEPVFGTVEELPELKIRRGTKVVLTNAHCTSLLNLRQQDIEGNYIYLKKTVAMLPYNNNNNYLVLGVVQNG